MGLHTTEQHKHVQTGMDCRCILRGALSLAAQRRQGPGRKSVRHLLMALTHDPHPLAPADGALTTFACPARCRQSSSTLAPVVARHPASPGSGGAARPDTGPQLALVAQLARLNGGLPRRCAASEIDGQPPPEGIQVGRVRITIPPQTHPDISGQGWQGSGAIFGGTQVPGSEPADSPAGINQPAWVVSPGARCASSADGASQLLDAGTER